MENKVLLDLTDPQVPLDILELRVWLEILDLLDNQDPREHKETMDA